MKLDKIDVFLNNISEAEKKATDGPGFIGHCSVDRNKIIEAFTASLDASIAHDPSRLFYFIETEDKRTIAFFGNGPTSSENANLWAKAKSHIPILVNLIKELRYQRDQIITQYYRVNEVNVIAATVATRKTNEANLILEGLINE